jgi:hypothetical protein
VFGKYGPMIEQLARRPNPTTSQPYSMSLLAAISHQEVVTIKLVEGDVDASVFEIFIYVLLSWLAYTAGKKSSFHFFSY